MIKIENGVVSGIAKAVYSARNAYNSWDKSDSDFVTDTLGENDLALAKSLIKSGSDHSKFMRMITVTCDITAPLFWIKELDAYKVGTVRNSCSTMHTIHKKKFEVDDFSIDNLSAMGMNILQDTICLLNLLRKNYLNTTEKSFWYDMIAILPSCYNQRFTWQANYAVLRNIYHARKSHKLTEWKDFCKWIESLSYSELITEKEE